MSVEISEELKETLMKSRGEERIMLVRKSKEGKVDFFPVAYRVKEVKDGTVVLEPVEAKTPSEQQTILVDEIMKEISSKIREDVEAGVRSALLEKTPGQLEAIRKAAPSAKFERKRGCFWLTTPEEELLL